jgi:hypothetical protein
MAAIGADADKVDKIVEAFFDELRRQARTEAEAANFGLSAIAWIIANAARSENADALLAEVAHGVRINRALIEQPAEGRPN